MPDPPRPYDRDREPRDREELIGCFYVLVATLCLAAGFVILYIIAADLP